jgi:O-antigen/teichoic acid export membrane protein
VAAIVLIPSHGADGTAIATTLGYVLSMVLAYVFSVRTAPVRVGDFIPAVPIWMTTDPSRPRPGKPSGARSTRVSAS